MKGLEAKVHAQAFCKQVMFMMEEINLCPKSQIPIQNEKTQVTADIKLTNPFNMSTNKKKQAVDRMFHVCNLDPHYTSNIDKRFKRKLSTKKPHQYILLDFIPNHPHMGSIGVEVFKQDPRALQPQQLNTPRRLHHLHKPPKLG